MDDHNDTPKPATKNVATHARQDRLGRALRENLKRRKAQARGRSASGDDGHAPATDAGTGPNDQASRERPE